MLGANPTKINWYNLSRNPSAMPIIREPRQILLGNFGFYRSEKICWTSLCFNPNAMDILEKKIKAVQDGDVVPDVV
jgi:hypothetical protein